MKSAINMVKIEELGTKPIQKEEENLISIKTQSSLEIALDQELESILSLNLEFDEYEPKVSAMKKINSQQSA